MTIYRCMACGTEVEVEKIKELGIAEVKPCEACLNAAEEESHEKGLEKGNEKSEKRENQCYRDGYAKGKQEGETKGYGKGFDYGVRARKEEEA